MQDADSSDDAGSGLMVADRLDQVSAAGTMPFKAFVDLKIINASGQPSSRLRRAENDISNIGSSVSAQNEIFSRWANFNLRTATSSISPTPDWIDINHGMSRWNAPSPIPGGVSGIGSSAAQEPIGNSVKDRTQDDKK